MILLKRVPNRMKYFVFGGVMTGLLSAGLFWPPFSFGGLLMLLTWPLFAPGLIFGIFLVFQLARKESVSQKIFYVIFVVTTYFLAVRIYTNFDGPNNVFIYSTLFAQVAASTFGAMALVLLTTILKYRVTFLQILGAGILAALLGLLIPINPHDSSDLFGPTLPRLWILFPVWQGGIGAYIGWITKPQPSIVGVHNQTSTTSLAS
jgi:hypothetical protein